MNGNYISEWFGHRMYPQVVSSSSSVQGQQKERCPFLSDTTGTETECIKHPSSKGVCTISSTSNGPRQDWVACPYRAFDREMMDAIATRLYDFAPETNVHIYSAPSLATEQRQTEVLRLIDADETVLVYFDQKMGGEIQLSATDRSPQVSFDTTFVQLVPGEQSLSLGRFAIMEIQTMDFHGSYRHAVKNLKDALRLHKDDFPSQVEQNQQWLSESIEGPNIANVFKRTFYQLMFKFEMALTPDCAGSALAIPVAVWDSWQKFLGAPDLLNHPNGTHRLPKPDEDDDQRLPCWIYVFDFDESADETPSPMRIQKMIRTSAEALAHHAIEEAPRAAIDELDAALYPAIRRRLRKYWPLQIEVPRRETPDQREDVTIAEETRPIEEAELED